MSRFACFPHVSVDFTFFSAAAHVHMILIFNVAIVRRSFHEILLTKRGINGILVFSSLVDLRPLSAYFVISIDSRQ